MNLNKLKFELIKLFPLLGKFITWNDGYVHEELKEEDYTVGASPLFKKVLQENGQWDEYLPAEERQHGRSIETMSCTCFGLMNVLETLFRRKFDLTVNKSDRFVAKTSGVSRTGNTLSRVLDSVRKNNGCVNEEVWPNEIDNVNWTEYFKAIPSDILQVGLNFINEWEVGFEAQWSTPQVLKEALKYSPLYCAGYAWYEKNGLYYSINSANHCFIIYGYEDGKYWKAFDSYEPYCKKLAWNFTIVSPKIITLNKKKENFNQEEIKKLLERGLKYVMRVFGNGEVYELSTEGLKYLSPQDVNNLAITNLNDAKKLVGINEEVYYKLIN